MKENNQSPRANSGYAGFQMAKALVTAREHQDLEIRKRAESKIRKWTSVLERLFRGDLDVGSRTPVKDTPAWVTLEVVTGGFATGEFSAGGDLRPYERELLEGLERKEDQSSRALLNAYFLTETGLSELQALLQSGRYDVDVPEEGALLTVAWLLKNDEAVLALELLDHLEPFFDRLRFYPASLPEPRRYSSHVHIQDVGRTIKDLGMIRPHPRIMAQQEAIQIWTPLYDKMIGLFLETVEGETPDLRKGPGGERLSVAKGLPFPVQGGWPCRTYPADWKKRALSLLAEYESLREHHQLCGRPEKRKDSFAQIRELLHQTAKAPEKLSGRDVGLIRLLLARYVAARGRPESKNCQELRERQIKQADIINFEVMAQAVKARLAPLPVSGGVDNPAPIIWNISEAEAQAHHLRVDLELPEKILKKLNRCINDTVDGLVERGVITSAEALAKVLPQITAGLRAGGISDLELRGLYAANYRAFRRRRSLLLLNLESQVQIEELPWVAAIERYRRADLSAKELARQTLEEVVILTISAFPQAILPNKFLQELRSLAKSAAMKIPLVDEIASDIFMGSFVDKFPQAALRAGELLEGTLYEVYYGISFQKMAGILKKKKSNGFAEYCAKRAGVKIGGWDTVQNGMLLEQEQILTTHNLAVLFLELNLSDLFRERLKDLARTILLWIFKRQQVKEDNYHAGLIMVKNTAYAWRQMIFFLALLPERKQREFMTWANGKLNEQKPEFRLCFGPALQGLELAVGGASPEKGKKARRFLGWTQGRHWILPCGPGRWKI